MDVTYSVCPVCRQVYPEDTMSFCTCINDKELFVHVDIELIRVAQRLMDKGFRVASCQYTSYGHSGEIIIEIKFYELYDCIDSVFCDLPPDWQVITTRYPSYLKDDSVLRTTLREHIAPGVHTVYERDLTISNLEVWLDSIDNDGMKAVLMLLGYPAGQLKLFERY